MDVIPSFLGANGVGQGASLGFLDNVRLRVGEVQEALYPSDPRNLSKKFIEYRVWVQHRENGTAASVMYENCVLMNAFGGAADKLTYTLRAEKSAQKATGSRRELGKGSKVLLLCMNGETHSPIIIGGLREPSDLDPKKADEKGHNLYFEFNGVAITIDKDGQLTLEVKGATEADSKPSKGVKTDALPSTVKIEKDGKITASTKGGKNSIVIEQTGKVTVTSEKEVTVVTQKAKVKADKCVVEAASIELGGEGIALPPQGVVLGSWVEPLTGSPVFALGGTSNVVFAKK